MFGKYSSEILYISTIFSLQKCWSGKVMPLIVQEIRYLDKLIDELTRENLWIKSFADEQEVRGIKCGNVQNAAVHLRIQIRIIIAARLQKQLKNI